jgi:hypothetical protein
MHVRRLKGQDGLIRDVHTISSFRLLVLSLLLLLLLACCCSYMLSVRRLPGKPFQAGRLLSGVLAEINFKLQLRLLLQPAI